jgi:hypothetical protein
MFSAPSLAEEETHHQLSNAAWYREFQKEVYTKL